MSACLRKIYAAFSWRQDKSSRSCCVSVESGILWKASLMSSTAGARSCCWWELDLAAKRTRLTSSFTSEQLTSANTACSNINQYCLLLASQSQHVQFAPVQICNCQLGCMSIDKLLGTKDYQARLEFSLPCLFPTWMLAAFRIRWLSVCAITLSAMQAWCQQIFNEALRSLRHVRRKLWLTCNFCTADLNACSDLVTQFTASRPFGFRAAAAFFRNFCSRKAAGGQLIARLASPDPASTTSTSRERASAVSTTRRPSSSLTCSAGVATDWEWGGARLGPGRNSLLELIGYCNGHS